ncbi:MAG: glycosyltransferase [Acidithiobacillus sp.]|nr:glycosyltransferase [Acidithiobacillus sp.]
MSGWWTLPAAWLALLAWLILVFGRGGFWRADQRLSLGAYGAQRTWPEVTAVVPARNEAEGIGDCVTALFRQDYPGVLRVIVVDDQSSDGTAECAREAAHRVDAASRLEVLSGAPLPENWAGKVWAMAQGVAAAGLVPLLWFTDGDIVHEPGVLQRLVTQIEDKDRSLVSLMVMLSCHSFWERLLIPPFIFFFQMLYPFPWVNNPRRALAGAAGGCMLLRREILEKAGGFAAMRAARIDDCTLAALLKPHGAIWLGLGTESHSLRDYQRLGEIWRMVARSAYVQLRFSLWRLLGAILGMIFLYAWPVGGLLFGLWTENIWLVLPVLLACLLMLTAYLPTLRLYRLDPFWAFSLPVAALLYTLMTLDSARRHYSGRGGAWKGRHYSSPGEEQ